MKVSIITECGREIGSGHLMRCLSLSEAFEERGIKPSFFVYAQGEAGESLGPLKARLIDWHRDSKPLIEAIEGSDIAIADSYLADKKVYRAMAKASKLTVYLDDENRVDYPPGVVVNGAIGAEEIDYPSDKEKRYLLSTPYLPLRRAFWTAPEKTIHETIGNILITFGGSDPRNFTPMILKLLSDRYPDWHKTVVIGKNFQGVDAIESIMDRKLKCIFDPDDAGMKALILASDLVISAGGQTVYECARLGTPLIAVSVSGNQSANVMKGQKAGFLEYAGTWTDEDLREKVLAKIALLFGKSAREKMQGIGRQTVDGLGALRTVNALLKDYLLNHRVIRPARIDDLIDIHALANDPEVRAFSFHEENIEFEDHEAWYNDKMRDPRCLLYVAEAGDLFGGQVRFDLMESKALISISVAKRWRGLGFGKQQLHAAIACLKKARPEIASVEANIKVENTVSIHFFESCGFAFLKDEVIDNKKAKTFRYRIKQKR